MLHENKFISKAQIYAPVIGRIFIAALFIISGFDKIAGYEGTQAWMNAMGVPGDLLPLTILVEIGGGSAIIIGWNTRIIAFVLAGFSILSAILFHLDPADQMQMIMFNKNIAIAGGFMFLVAFGPGAYSLDNRNI